MHMAEAGDNQGPTLQNLDHLIQQIRSAVGKCSGLHKGYNNISASITG